VFTVRLRKNAATKSYGFSVSDGSTTFTSPTVAGIYVNSVLEGSVAESVGIRHMDRVLQVNGTSMDCLNCDLALPLLAAEELELVLMRGGEPSDGGDHPPIGDGTLMGERKMSSIVQSSV
jgi:C-terminal processing protease CtpA/Prc